MPKQTKVCRVCGKTYEACRSIKTGSSVFNWREVACSPECGSSYLKQVMASRSAVSEAVPNGSVERTSRKKKDQEPPVVDVGAEIANESEHTNTEALPEDN